MILGCYKKKERKKNCRRRFFAAAQSLPPLNLCRRRYFDISIYRYNDIICGGNKLFLSFDAEFLKLFFGDRSRSLSHEAGCARSFPLWINLFINTPREWNHILYMRHTKQPSYQTLQSHSQATVRNCSIFSEITKPSVIFFTFSLFP